MPKVEIHWSVTTTYQAVVDLPEGASAHDYIAEHGGDIKRETMDGGFEIDDVIPVKPAVPPDK